VAAWPSAAVAATTCQASAAPGAKVVIASRKAIVYKRRESDPLRGKQWIHYGCLYSRDREWPLTQFVEFRQFLGPWALAGRYVAYAYDAEEAAGGEQNDEIHVVDLRTGKQKAGARQAAIGSTQGESRVHAIVVKRNASVAWIASFHEEDFDNILFQVWAIEDGKRRKLDEGRTIKPHSLALSANGKTLYWHAGSETRSENLR
jgi:hypothetical protein